MKTTWQKVSRFISANAWTPYVLLFLVMLLFFGTISLDYGDDGVFRSLLAGTTPTQMALDYRQTWSARIVIELVLFHLYALPSFLWRVLNCLMLVLLPYSFTRLLGLQQNTKANWLAAGVVLLFPLAEMINAGWMATTCNYLWPATLGLYAITPWANRLANRPVKLYSYILSLLALVYAANAEQMMAICLGFAIVAFVYMAVKRQRPNAYQFIWLAIVLAMLVQQLLAPGPKLRIVEEAAMYYPDFATTSVFTRLHEVFMHMSWTVFVNGTIPFLVASLVVMLAVYDRHKGLATRILASIPFGVSLLFGALYPATGAMFPSLYAVKANSPEFTFGSSLSDPLLFLLYLAVWVFLLYGVCRAATTRQSALGLAVVFLAGFLSQLIMFMAPSAAISVQRYTTYIHLALLFIAFALLRGLLQQPNHLRGKAGAITTGALAGANLINLLFSW